MTCEITISSGSGYEVVDAPIPPGPQDLANATQIDAPVGKYVVDAVLQYVDSGIEYRGIGAGYAVMDAENRITGIKFIRHPVDTRHGYVVCVGP